ncbi:MAG: 2-C-methyl-D-erythritol 4-phosphate cytidylyltransferase, partial [Pseudomonadota bacterium]
MTSLWAVVPAAGVGRRVGGETPKQYLPLAGRSVIDHSIAPLIDHPDIEAVCVALGPEDPWWPSTDYSRHPGVLTVTGGEERVHSVRNALEAVAARSAPEDWVLVHDAARPNLRAADLDHLIDVLRDHVVGGVLGMPVRDTMKRADAEGVVRATVSREGLWHAFTPQMFRIGVLIEAIDRGFAAGFAMTDEASAMEAAGHAPLMVAGHADNLKITHPEDLPL